MPSRKTHSKSRHGCVQCKARSLKPPYTRCRTRKDECCYKNLVASSDTFQIITQPAPDLHHPPDKMLDNHVFNVHAPRVACAPQNEASLSPDVELIYHLTTSTSFDILIQHPSELWRNLAPQLALTRNFFMHGLLACSAMHLAYLNPRSVERYTDLAMQHHTVALAQFREELNNITKNNAVSLFLLSAVVICTSYAMPQAASQPLTVDETMQHFLDIFRLQTGIMEVLNASRVYLQDAPILWMLNVPFNENTPIPAEDEDMLSLIEQRIDLEAELELKDIYVKAASELRRCFPLKDRPGERHAMFLAWPIMISSRLFVAAEEKMAIAVALVVFYGTGLHTLDSSWWARGKGKQLVLAAISFLRRMKCGAS